MPGGSQAWIQRLLPGNHSQNDDCVDDANRGGVNSVTFTTGGVGTCEIAARNTQAQQTVALRTSRNQPFYLHLFAQPGPNLTVGTTRKTNIGFNTGRSATHNKSFDLQTTNPRANSGELDIQIWETAHPVGDPSRLKQMRKDRGTLEIEVDIR